MLNKFTGLPVIAGLLFSVASSAADVKITWQEPDSYTDIRPANQSRGSFRKQIFSQLESHFSELAEALPDDMSLAITVTNIDLAGEVWPSSFVGIGTVGTDIRLVRQVDIPRLAFSYSLTDADDTEVKGEDVSLKDMNFLNSQVRSQRWQNLSYEKAMLARWFDETFSDYITRKE